MKTEPFYLVPFQSSSRNTLRHDSTGLIWRYPKEKVIRSEIQLDHVRNLTSWIFMSSILIGYGFLYCITHSKSIQSLIPKGCYFNAFMELFSLISIHTEIEVTKMRFCSYMPPSLHQALIDWFKLYSFSYFPLKMFFVTLLLPELQLKTDLAWLQKLPEGLFVFIHGIESLSSLLLQSSDITDCWSNMDGLVILLQRTTYANSSVILHPAGG